MAEETSTTVIPASAQLLRIERNVKKLFKIPCQRHNFLQIKKYVILEEFMAKIMPVTLCLKLNHKNTIS